MSDNNLGNLNDLLFAEMRRLSDADATDSATMEAEVARARAMVDVGGTIIQGAGIVLDVAKLRAQHSRTEVNVPRMLGE